MCYMISMIQAGVIFVCVVLSMLSSCYLPGETMFSDQHCFDWTSPGMEIIMMIPFTYMTWDLVIIKKVYGEGALVK